MMHFKSDVFVEYMVRRKFGTKDYLIVVGVVVAAIILLAAAFMFLPNLLGDYFAQFILIIVCGIIYGAYVLIGRNNLEFEYTFTNGDITIDKIMSRKARKRVTSFDCSQAQEIGDYTRKKDALKSRTFTKTIFAGTYQDGRNNMYIIANSKNTGLTLLVFEPNESMIDAIKITVPRHLRIEFWGK